MSAGSEQGSVTVDMVDVPVNAWLELVEAVLDVELPEHSVILSAGSWLAH